MSALRTGGVTVVRLGTSGRATAHVTGRYSWHSPPDARQRPPPRRL